MYVLVVGNPIDGLQFVGPFPDHDAAVEYAERYEDQEWWVTSLDKPKED